MVTAPNQKGKGCCHAQYHCNVIKWHCVKTWTRISVKANGFILLIPQKFANPVYF